MANALRLRALYTVGIYMGHNIMAYFFLTCFGNIIIDVIYMSLQLVDLFQGQLRLFQRDLLHVGQILEILHQRIVVIVPHLQRQLGDVRREGLASQIDFVKNLAPGQLLLGGFQNRVIAASGGVQGFQLGEIV